MREKSKQYKDKGLRVLLIEDNPEDEMMVRRLLSKAPSVGDNIQSVCSYADAADALGQTFDVCLMDYDLGKYSAIELLAELPVQQLTGPVILLTGHEDFEIDQAALELGVADYITKSQVTSALLDRTLRYCRRQYEDQRRLSFLAEHDPLTHLLNRHAFLDRLSGWLETTPLDRQDIYLLYIDLDGFKGINDNWGHDVGDLALRHTSSCIFDAVRESDLISRYGGDEIVAAVAHVGRDKIEDLASKILTAIRRPFKANGEDIVITASIGISRASQAPNDPQEMIRLADHAMFAAKRSGRDGIRVYSSDVPVLARDRAGLESDLRNALKADGLHLVYQPQINLRDGHLTGGEALARWQHPTRGAVGPATFIPLAEECGLIRQITEWSVEAAITKLAQWAPMLSPEFRLSVNISPAQLLHPAFAEHLLFLLQQNPGAKQWLRLEITESFFLHANAALQLNKLCDAGVSLALDDFGTGYSSLSQLARLPIDTLKIDLEFVKNLVQDPRMAALTRAIISIAKDLGMDVIAEGIETQEQATLLSQFGCELGQGYLYAAGEDEATFANRLSVAHKTAADKNTDA